MAIKINFDSEHGVIEPTFVLVTRGGKKIGRLPAYDWNFEDTLGDAAQMSFAVDKEDCDDDVGSIVWEQLVDFKLVWVKEWNRLFEIAVDLSQSSDTVKNVTAMALGNAELSQINVYGLEINTEDDIGRNDYAPSVLCDTVNTSASILHRVLRGAPHYQIGHVDSSISKIQRTFSFDKKDIMGCLNDIAKEIGCLFIIECGLDGNMNIVRRINVYDLESYCPTCGNRGPFITSCDKCGNSNIIKGYGVETPIFINTDNLADEITYTTDTKSVKNCFRLEAGDDLMTATIINCNPNGTGNIWYISDELKADMSTGLVQKINAYDDLYDYYVNENAVSITSGLRNQYNALVTKYNQMFSKSFKTIPASVTGYAAFMEIYYDTIDMYLFLNNSMMPDASMQNTNAANESAKLSRNFMTNVAVRDISALSSASADNAVLAMAKSIVDNRYQVRIVSSVLSGTSWSGKFAITNFSDEEDTATTNTLSCIIIGDYERYLKQLIDKTLKKSLAAGDTTDIVSMFNLSNSRFAIELQKYSLTRLQAFNAACTACVDLLIQNGISEKETTFGAQNGLYDTVYTPYYDKLAYIDAELIRRNSEIETVVGKLDSVGQVVKNGVQTELFNAREQMHQALNFEEFLGTDLWLEFSSYRRDDVYTNENYVSDGLDNTQIFKLAMQFIEEARKDIFKSATLQHSISASLLNPIVLNDFFPILDAFEVGNWIRIAVGGEVYRLRLIGYQVSGKDLRDIQVTFSDVTTLSNGISDLESILNSASSMASSYDYVARQAKNGSDSKGILSEWVNIGLSLTNMKIVNNADNQNITWDSNGLLAKEFIPELETYDDRQLKIINRGLYVTDDNWKTSRAGIGDFIFYNPKTRNYEESYGVIADTLVGNLILSREVGIYNESGSIEMSKDGFIITSDQTDGQGDTPIFLIQKNIGGNNYPIMSLDQNGLFRLNASQVLISSSNDLGDRTFDMLEDGIKAYADSKIQTNSNEILLSVEERYSTKDELGVIESAMASRIDQTSQEIGFYFEAAESRIEDVDGELRSQIDEIKTNFRFTPSGQYIGVEGSDAIMHLYNDVMEILVSGNPVTTVNRSGLIAAEASITTLHIGDYLWTYDEVTGHMTLT